MVEDEQQDDQDDLVEELTPALHQESAGDLAATVETILLVETFPEPTAFSIPDVAVMGYSPPTPIP